MLGNCNDLLSLNLRNNSLSGKIPTELGNLDHLQVMLDLSSNSLCGPIPENLKKLASLENLNLSHNHLSGKIPQTLSSMISIQSLDISFNNLSGAVPSDSFFKKGTYMGNPGLCGNATGLSFCSDKGHQKHRKNVVVSIIVPIASVLLLIACAIASLLWWRHKKQSDEESNSSDVWGTASLIWERKGRFTFSEISKATNNFSDTYCIGKGGFGIIYKVCLPSGQVVAVKKFNISESSDIPASNRQSLENEIKALTEVRHRTIVKLYGFCSKDGSMYLVCGYIERGSLGNLLNSEEVTQELGWGRRVNII